MEAEKATFLADIAENVPKKQFVFNNKAKLVRALNKEVSIVFMGPEVRFASLEPDGALTLRKRRDAELAFSQYQYIPKDKNGNAGNPQAGFSIWLKSPDRRQYTKLVFKPNPADVRPNELNLWQGYAIAPKAGDWGLFRDHLFNNVCQGDEAHYNFLLAVLAQMFQQPWRKIGICIVLRGGLGVGKSKVSDWLGTIIGPRHAPVIDKPEQLTGRFTGQLEYALLARVEEGYYPGDPTSKAAMKHLITGGSLMVERKGLDAYEVSNYTRVLITTNSEWAVPASSGERRYFFLDVGDARKQDGAYFAAIDDQMSNGGAAAFLHHLMTLDISSVDFSKPPMTSGLNEQIQLGFSSEEKWLESCLCEGRLPFKSADIETVEWENTPFAVKKDLVVQSYREFVPGFRSPPTPQTVGIFLNKIFPLLEETRPMVHGQRIRHWVLPSLDEARTAFKLLFPGYDFPQPSNEHGEQNAAKPNVVPLRQSNKA